MSSPAVTPFISSQAIEYGAVRGTLQLRIQRSGNSQSAFMDLVSPVFRFQIAPDFLHEIGSGRVRVMGHVQPQRLVSRLGGLLGSDLAVFQHGVDYQVAAFD